MRNNNYNEKTVTITNTNTWDSLMEYLNENVNPERVIIRKLTKKRFIEIIGELSFGKKYVSWTAINRKIISMTPDVKRVANAIEGKKINITRFADKINNKFKSITGTKGKILGYRKNKGYKILITRLEGPKNREPIDFVPVERREHLTLNEKADEILNGVSNLESRFTHFEYSLQIKENNIFTHGLEQWMKHILIFTNDQFIRAQIDSLKEINKLYAEGKSNWYDIEDMVKIWIANTINYFEGKMVVYEGQQLLSIGYLFMGAIHFYEENYSKAKTLFEKSYNPILLTKEKHLISIILFFLGVTIFKIETCDNRYDLALDKFKNCLKYLDKKEKTIRPMVKRDISIIWINKGKAIEHIDIKKAIGCYNKAIEIDPNCPFAWSTKGLILEYKYSRHKQAKALFYKAILLSNKAIEKEKDPIGKAEYQHHKAKCFISLKKAKQATECFDKALKLNENYIEAWIDKGEYQQFIGNYPEAEKSFNEAIKRETEPIKVSDYLHKKAICLIITNKINPAMNCLDEAIEKNPNNTIAWNTKGVCLLNSGEHEHALECFDTAIKLYPKYAGSWLNKGSVLAKSGHYNDALLCFNKSVELEPRNPFFWRNRGRCLEQLKNYSEAIQSYEMAHKIDPNNLETYFSLVNGYVAGGRIDDAITYLKRILNKNRNSSALWSELGNLYAKKGQLDRRDRCLFMAAKINKRYGLIWIMKAHNYAKANNLELYLKCIKNAIKYEPNFRIELITKDNLPDKFRTDPRLIKLLKSFERV